MYIHALNNQIYGMYCMFSVYYLFSISNPKQPSCKKKCSPQKDYGEKRYEIQGGGQEMAVMVR